MTIVACLGVGRIGGEVAYVSALRKFADELVLFDISEPLQHAQKLDIIHGMDIPVSTNPADLKDADYCIFSAGYSRSPNIKTRADLFDKNLPIAKESAELLKGFSGKLIVVTNPMDVFTWYFAKKSCLDETQVVGFGGLLDSRRFTVALKALGIEAECQVLGEHGEHQVPLFSPLGIDIPIPVREEILTGLRGSSMPVIKGKAGTVFGPAYHIVSMLEKIEKGGRIICSLPANGAYGIDGCSLGLPAVVTRSGAKIDESLKFDPWEMEKLLEASDFLQGLCRRVQMEIAINQAEYSNAPGGPIVHIFGREADGTPHQLKVTGFRPYFWVRENEADKPHTEKIDVTQDRGVSIKGEPLRRIYTEKPGDVRNIRDNYHHFEADIPFATRFLIDTGLTGGVRAPSDECSFTELSPAEVISRPRVCMCDIECDDRNGFPEPERDPIICITCHDSFDDRYTTFVLNGKTKGGYENAEPLASGCFSNCHTIISYDTERDLFAGFIDYIREKDPDILSGWNFIEFDAEYILKRAETLGFRAEVFARMPGMTERNAMRGRVIFDLLAAYKKMQGSQKESYRLDAVAEDELGETKVRYTGTLGDLWNNDPLKMVEYNFKDVELCVGINRKNNIIEFYQEVARYVGCPLDKTLNSSNVIDIYILRKAFGKFILPSKGNATGEEFEGATVFDPSKGVRENVIVLDLKSLYPMAMMTLNASPETKSSTGEIHAPNGIRFKKSPDGLTRSIISELMAERDERKKLRNSFPFGSDEYTLYDMQQNVLKVIMNTYYGVSGFSRFRLYDRDIGAAVTSVGRAIIQHTKLVITRRGYEVIYGDTDSCFIQIPPASLEETMKIAREIEEELNASYQSFAQETLGADMNFFSIKFEKIYRRFFQGGAKKRYAGHLIWKEGQDVDKIDITGFEMKRSDSAQITREVQERVLEMILKGNGREEVKKYLPEVLNFYRTGNCPLEKAGIPSGINKSLADYAHLDSHGRGAIYSNTYLGTDFKRGSKPKRLYIKRTNMPEKYPDTDVLCFEYPDQVPAGAFEIDWETMLEKTIQAPLNRIFDALGWDWDEFDPTKSRKTTLDMFF